MMTAETAWQRRTRREAARAAHVAAHGNRCELCGNAPKSRGLSEDHDHKTGAHRGWLCYRCNRALPAYVTFEWLRKAVAYLERAGCPVSSEALREAKVWLEQLASADRELVRTSGLAAALLAEVARLEQERDEAKHQRDNFERIARERAENAHVNWQARGVAEAALAVAREALELIANGSLTPAAVARAALVDEPAADGPFFGGGVLGPPIGPQPAAATLAKPGRAESRPLGLNAESGSRSDHSPGSASAAADEPPTVLACPECGAALQLGHDCLAAADDGRCPGCGWYVADCNCVARAAADEPGETP